MRRKPSTVLFPSCSMRSERSSVWTLVALCLGFSLVIVDTTMITVGLPQMQEELRMSPRLMTWAADAYTLAFAALLLTSGAIADRRGARRVYLNGIALIAVGSTVCAVAESGWLLVAGRAVQGIGAAGVIPGSLSLIESSYPDARRKARAIVVWATVGSLASVAGLVLSGVLVSAFTWRSLFWASLAMSVVTLILSRASLQETPTRPAANRMSVLSQCMLLTTLTAFVAGAIEWGATHSAGGVALVAAGALSAVALVTVERHSSDPTPHLALLRHRGARAMSAIGLLVNFGFYGQLLLFTGFLQHFEGLSPLQSGLVITVEAAGAVCGSPCGSWIAGRYSPIVAMLTGLSVSTVGFLAMATGAWSHTSGLTVAASFFVGAGIDIVITPATAHMLRIAPAGHAGTASALLTMARQIGAVLGVAVLGTLGAAATPSPGSFSSALIVAALVFVAAAYLLCGRFGPRQGQDPVRGRDHTAERTGNRDSRVAAR